LFISQYFTSNNCFLQPQTLNQPINFSHKGTQRDPKPQPKARKKWREIFCLKSIVMKRFPAAGQNFLAKKTKS